MPFASVPELLTELAAGRMIVLVDDAHRENEGDLCMAAEKVTQESINFMLKHGRGILCMTMEEDKAERLDLRVIPSGGFGTRFGTAFMEPVDARKGVSTGVSAA